VKLILIGTDHRLQQTVIRDTNTKAWLPRKDGHRYHTLIAYCIDKLGAKAIVEEAHADQEKTAPTICSKIAKERGLPWQSIGLSEPSHHDALCDPPFMDAVRARVKPDMLAGVYDLQRQGVREEFMHTNIAKFIRVHDSVLAVVGFVHLGVLARRFAAEGINVEAFVFTYPLVVDETLS
jgi:hypothetical protein